MTGKLAAVPSPVVDAYIYFENANCRGRIWYLFNDVPYMAPMLAFTLTRYGLSGHTYALAKDVVTTVSADMPKNAGSFVQMSNGVCVNQAIGLPQTTVVYSTGTAYRFYVEYKYVLPITNPEDFTLTPAPFRFVPNL